MLQLADANDLADRRIILGCHHNSVIYEELCAGHKPIRQEIDVWETVTVHDNPLAWRRTTRWRSVWLRVASLGHSRRDSAALATAAAGVAAAVWHVHQLIPMTSYVNLDCSDLLALICQPRAPWHLRASSSLAHQCTPWMSHACLLMLVLPSAFVPMSARLSSLLTRRTLNLSDMTSSCNHKCATSMCFILPILCR